MEETRAGRSSWLMSTLSLTAAPIVYFVVGLQVAPTTSPAPMLATLRLVFIPLAIAAVAIGAGMIRRAPRAAADASAAGAVDALATPGDFTYRFIVGAALIETSAVLGFVLVMMGAPLADYLPFGAGTLLMMTVVALPTGLRYWSERERAGPGRSGTSLG
jgi:F0F1-type ATP synthase membrane subunit c/vacuolar-type H+-ATPase subunit K